MTVDAWLAAATEDARRRGLDALVPLLETLARSTRGLREANEAARKPPSDPAAPPQDAR
jgi:hypothetical protein